MKCRLLARIVLFPAVMAMATVTFAGGEEFEGLIKASETVEISSQTPGIIERILVERGDPVTAGDEVVRLKSGFEKATVELARARLEFGKRKVVRNEDMYKKQLISIHEKDEMETESLINEMQLREEEERLNMRIIRTPITGVVVKRGLSAGEYVGEGSILTIARIDPLFAEVIVPVAYYGSVQKGMTAEVRPEAPIGGRYYGKVIIVDQVVDAASGTFGVRVELPNPTMKLPAGLKCQVRFQKK